MRVAVDGAGPRDESIGRSGGGFFDVIVWNDQGERCAEYLGKGRLVGVSGRLTWREWEAKDGGGKRQAVEIVAFNVKFLDWPEEDEGGQRRTRRQPDDDFQPASAPGFDDPDSDITF